MESKDLLVLITVLAILIIVIQAMTTASIYEKIEEYCQCESESQESPIHEKD